MRLNLRLAQRRKGKQWAPSFSARQVYPYNCKASSKLLSLNRASNLVTNSQMVLRAWCSTIWNSAGIQSVGTFPKWKHSPRFLDPTLSCNDHQLRQCTIKAWISRLALCSRINAGCFTASATLRSKHHIAGSMLCIALPKLTRCTRQTRVLCRSIRDPCL